MAKQITTREAGSWAARRMEFDAGKGPTLYGRWMTRGSEQLYVVYSYGPHFPLYIWHDEREGWFANQDKYSLTTTRHASRAHPGGPTTPVSLHSMLMIERHGLIGFVQGQIQDAAAGRR